MSHTDTTPPPQPCGTCGDTGQVQVSIYNTATGQTTTITETCLACP